MSTRRLPALFALLASLPFAAHASTITSSAISPIAMGASADSISLASSTGSFTNTGVFHQAGTFSVGDSGCLDGTFNFSFVDNITVDGITQAVRIFGSDRVTPATDTLSLFASGPVSIGAYTWSLHGFDLTAANIQNYSFDLAADVSRTSTTPEPAGLVLLGTGTLISAFITRRRLYTL